MSYLLLLHMRTTQNGHVFGVNSARLLFDSTPISCVRKTVSIICFTALLQSILVFLKLNLLTFQANTRFVFCANIPIWSLNLSHISSLDLVHLNFCKLAYNVNLVN